VSARRAAALALAAALAACAPTGAPDCAPGTAPGMVTTLFFGLSRHDKPDVAESEWRDFLSHDLLANLPGATVVEGRGLFRDPGAAVVAEEATRVVTVGHHGGAEDRRALAAAVERYKARFDQWGVGRVDSVACTNFE